ncbi:hypothetical protein O3M35_011746 [Rhynocoris fuscipes]|uniref:Uncharacterized protein n=1 Tax=Rhynocoris fuscipes TaxID=488301 RepID=A0AAW1CZ94_9HEMI
MVNVKVPEVNKFCFCIPLEIGAKIFAFLHLIIGGLILAFLYYIEIRFYATHPARHEFEGTDYILQLAEIGGTLQIVFGFYLLIGLYERSPAFLLSWIMYEMTSVIIGIYIVILELGFGFNHKWRYPLLTLRSTLEEVAFIVAYSFFCLMIYGVYKKYSRERDEKGGEVKWSRRDPNSVY